MKDAIAIAIAKAKLRRHQHPYNASSNPDDLPSVNQALTRTTLGILLITGVLVGFGGLACMLVGLFKSGGVKQFFSGLCSALGIF